ncbi:hypothetical protein HUT19_20850 [Streptomyces sp. NA02950]|uniref:hypothetical protein n=1 Tax=Streptomyces sp. NA02950 TaxID=2742137 RepID=UPI001590FA1D|nr:hypothetical protein [Streptomyces sp. NA02950]QKV93907.1 hypothetical protein HUT19_20850 [Streptomyces sp. NA02950]
MAGEVWASVLSLAGVALGGGLTAFAQHATQRSAERAEERRQVVAAAESRRAEQLEALKEFIARAQTAERAAYSRPEEWGDDEDWTARAGEAMTALWTASGNVMLLCDEALHEPVRVYGHALNQAVWREIGDLEVNEHLEAGKSAFMAAARRTLASS